MTKREMKMLFELLEGLALLWESGNKKVDRAQALFDDVYRFSHLGTCRCKNKHEDWMEGAKRLHKAFKEKKLI